MMTDEDALALVDEVDRKRAEVVFRVPLPVDALPRLAGVEGPQDPPLPHGPGHASVEHEEVVEHTTGTTQLTVPMRTAVDAAKQTPTVRGDHPATSVPEVDGVQMEEARPQTWDDAGPKRPCLAAVQGLADDPTVDAESPADDPASRRVDEVHVAEDCVRRGLLALPRRVGSAITCDRQTEHRSGDEAPPADVRAYSLLPRSTSRLHEPRMRSLPDARRSRSARRCLGRSRASRAQPEEPESHQQRGARLGHRGACRDREPAAGEAVGDRGGRDVERRSAVERVERGQRVRRVVEGERQMDVADDVRGEDGDGRPSQ